MKLKIDKNIQDIPYYPRAMGYGQDDGWVKLASNENPFPPSPEVVTAVLDAIYTISRYPGAELELKTLIGERYGIKREQVALGNGSDEIIEMILKAMKYRGRNRVIITEPSFAFYAIASKIFDYEVVRVPLKKMKVDLNAVKDAIDSQTRVIFLNNPLNPTGTIFKGQSFHEFVHGLPPDVLVVVDEAYAEFVEDRDFPDSVRYIEDFPVVVLRTFSKAYALAGLRIGYCLGEPSLVSYIERTRQPFSINSIAIAAAGAALKDRGYLKKVLDNNKKGKRFFYKVLKDLSLEYIPTEANFILVRIGNLAQDITKKLFEQKILVRWMGAYNLPDYIRITIGRMDENRRLIEALKR